ncbi:hypothetical protein MRX96_058394 [Rhipicephalus microplus]
MDVTRYPASALRALWLHGVNRGSRLTIPRMCCGGSPPGQKLSKQKFLETSHRFLPHLATSSPAALESQTRVLCDLLTQKHSKQLPANTF